MKYLLESRFNMIELTCCSAMSIFLAQGKFLAVLIVLCVCSLVSSIATVVSKQQAQRARDAQWQQLAKNGCTVEAIKEHRRVYGSALKEALDTVERFQGKPPR